MKTFAINFFAFCLILVLMMMSCKKQDIKENEPISVNDKEFREVINTGGGFLAPVVSYEETNPSVTAEVIDGENWNCTTKTVSIEDGSGGNSGYPLFSPNADVIYPGSMLQGNSLSSGTPNPKQ